MAFQTQVNRYPAPGVVGAHASQNPVATVDAGQLGLVAGSNSLIVGKFAWNSYPVAGGPGQANNAAPTPLTQPDGFVCNEQQALITIWLGIAGLAVPAGYNITEFNMGDFWANNIYADAAIGNKVFVNTFTGDVIGAAAGSFLTNPVGSAAVIPQATIVAGSYSMYIASITSGVPEAGDTVLGLNIPGTTFIESLGTFNGTVGTVTLTQAAVVTQTLVPVTTTAPLGPGGATGTVSGTNGSPTVTIAALSAGAVVAGLLIQGTGIPANSYVASLGTFNGVSGTIVLNNNATAAIGTVGTPTAASFSPFLETDWIVRAAANVGDLVKIGTRY